MSGIVDAYFNRIGFKGESKPSLEVLREIQLLHAQNIPFENIDILLGKTISLDITSINNKLVVSKRGGFCFEQNLLLSYILRELGFSVKHLAARMLWNIPEHSITPRSHMLLLVEIEGTYWIADVGFGGGTPTSPLNLTSKEVQKTNHEHFRILKKEDEFIVQSFIRNNWNSLYKFDLQEQQIVDYEMTNWYLCNHPESHFRNGLLVSRVGHKRRYALQNNRFTIHRLNDKSKKQQIKDVQILIDILTNHFNLKLSDNPELLSVLKKYINN